MPIYDYTCSACRHTVEVVHSIHDDGPRFCPSCGADGTMRKAIAKPAIHFKGSGWAKKDRSATSSPGSSSASKTESTSEGPTSKPSADAAGPAAESGSSGATSAASSAPAATD